MSEATMNLLDATLDDLADLPEFVTPPPGAYALTFKGYEQKKVNDNACVIVTFTVAETQELASADSTPVEPGTEFNQMYNMSNEYGQGGLKNLCKPLGEALGVSRLSEVLEGAKGMAISATIKNRKDKNSDRVYAQVENVVVL